MTAVALAGRLATLMHRAHLLAARAARGGIGWRVAIAGWRRHLGWPALAAITMLAVALVLHVFVRPRLIEEQQRLASVRQSIDARIASRPAMNDTRTRAEILIGDTLPGASLRGRDLEWLVLNAEDIGLAMDHADFTLRRDERSDVVRVEATLPLTGTYGELRRFVATSLNELPHLALSSLDMERPNAQETRLLATAHLVLFYRREGP